MDFQLSEEQRILFDMAGRFVQEALALKPAADRPTEAEIWLQVAEMGWLSLPLSEYVGGLGGAFEDVLVLMTALGRGVLSVPYTSNVILCGDILDQRLDAPGAAEALAGLGSGEVRLALAETDSLAGEVTATRSEQGFVLRGGKTLSYGAAAATKLIVWVTGGDDGPSLFLLDASAPGIRLEPYPLIDGSSAADMRFDNVVVTEDQRLALGAAAAALLARAKDRAVLANLAQIVGCIEECLVVCSDYLKVREQFGQPIGRFQALQHMMSAMFIEAQEARSIMYYALSKIDEPEQIRREAVEAARIVISDAGKLVTEHGIQLHGGYGVTDEFAISHHYRKVFSLTRSFASH